MKVDTNWYFNQQPQHHIITVPTHTILHPQLEVNTVTYFHAIPKIVCNRTQAKKSMSRYPKFFTDSDHDYILEKIGCREKVSFKDM